MAGKARRTPTYSDDMRTLTQNNAELYSLFRNKDTPHSVVRPTFGTAASIADATGKLATHGDTMIGPIAFATLLISIASDAINVSKGSRGYSSRIIVAPESGTADNLVTITGGNFDGQLLMIQGIQSDTITVKNSGNIETIDSNDFQIVDDDIVIFIFDVTDNKWQQVTTGKSGNFANKSLSNLTSPTSINQSLIPNADGTLDLGDGTHRWNDLYVQRTRFKNASVVANKPMITADATDGMILNVATGQIFNFKVNDVSKWSIDATDLTGTKIVLSDNLLLQNIASDPVSAGQFRLNGTDVKVYSGGAVRNLSSIGAAGGANVNLSNLSSPTAINQDLLPNADATLNLGDSTHRWKDVFLEQARFKQGTVVANKPVITADATDGMILNIATGQIFNFKINDVSKWSMDNVNLTGTSLVLSNLITLGDNAADPPATNGIFARNATHVKVYSGGAVRNLSDIGAAGGANVNLSNLGTTSINSDLIPNADGTLDLGTSSLSWDDAFVKQVRFKSTGGTVTTNIPMITSSATGDLILNVNTSDKFDFQVLGVSKWTIDNSTITGANITLTNALSINDSSTITTTAGQFTRSGTVIYIGGAFAPGNTGTQDLGGSGRVWNDFWVEQVRFHQGSVVANKPIITANATDGMILNVATGQIFDLRVNNVAAWSFDSLQLSGAKIVLSDHLLLQNIASDPVSNGQFRLNGTNVKVYSGGSVRNLSDIVAGGITYPLTPDKNARGNVTGTVTIDLSLANAHVQTMTLIGNVTFVFSNPPASTKNIQFQLDITQDATGGRTITWPASVTVIPTLSTAAGSRYVLLCQTSNGGTNYDVFSTGTAASVLNAANQTLSNLTDPTSLNADLHMNAKNIIFDADGSLGSSQEIVRLAGGLTFGVPTGEAFQFFINGTEEYHLTSSDFDFKSNNLKGVGTTITGSTTTNVLQQDANGWTYKVGTGDSHIFTINSVTEYDFSSTIANFHGNDLTLGAGVATFHRWESDLSSNVNINTSSVQFQFNTPAATGSMQFSVGGSILFVIGTSHNVSFVDFEMLNGTNFVFQTTTGTKFGTDTTQKMGWWNATPVGRSSSAALTNNVSVGGTTDTITNYSDLLVYANDATTIRNDLYQLARKIKEISDALRLYGLLG